MEQDIPLATVAHEFLSPLAALRGYVELAIKDAPQKLAPQQREHLETALLAADRLQHFIEDVVEIARIESGDLKPTPTRVPPSDLIDHALHNLRKSGRRGLEIVVRCPELPTVPVDVRLLGRVLDRLIRHALQFVPQPGKLEIEVEEADGAVVFTFLELGVSLDEEERARLFERFVQPYFAEAGRRLRQNSVAMAAARLVVERHGGRIWSEARPEGLALRFRLPR